MSAPQRMPKWFRHDGEGTSDWKPTLAQSYLHKIVGCSGLIISKIDDHGHLWIALQCCTCGKIIGSHDVGDLGER